MEALQQAREAGDFRGNAWTQDEAQWRAFLSELRKPEWGSMPTLYGGPKQVIAYLGRYTHRTAISEQRLIKVGDQRVRFRVRRGVPITLNGKS